MAIKGYIPCSFLDWPGLLTGVIFVGGCNLHCWYCHNAELAWHPEKFDTIELDDILSSISKQKRKWMDAITITGGEPTLDPFLCNYIEAIKKNGFKVKVDTNGIRSDVIEKILPLVDLIAMDVKAPLADYESIVGPVRIGDIEKSIELLRHSEKVIFRVTAAPGVDVEKIRKELQAPLLVQLYRGNDHSEIEK